MRVFKYRGGPEDIVRRDLRSLCRNEIYAAPIESLNDLFEAQVKIHGQTFRVGHILSAVGLAAYNKKMAEAEDRFLGEIEEFARKVRTWGVYSLSRSATDELLWAYYADAHRGFCLEYELDELLTYKLQGQGWTEVDYQDNVPTITLNDLVGIQKSQQGLTSKLIGTKSRRWKHEDEVRVVTGQPGLFEYDFRALKAIYFGARSTPHLRRRLMRALAGRGLRYFQVSPTGQTYALKVSEVTDPFARPPDYRKRVAPIEEGVPSLDSKTSAYKNEIMRAIEIVRREPYCEKVVDAYLSSRGTVDNPVFYVTYQRSDGLPQNFFLSRDQIKSACIQE